MHVDEEWFQARALHGRRKMPKGVEPTPLYITHKSHMPKVMFLAATGRKRNERKGWDMAIFRRCCGKAVVEEAL